jgi:hypothetical protein
MINTFLNNLIEIKNKHFSVDFSLLNQMAYNDKEKI